MPRKTFDRKAVALQWRRTKIIATLGPASDSPEMIARMVDAGVDLFRINMSHGDQETHRKTVKRAPIKTRVQIKRAPLGGSFRNRTFG